MECGRGLGFSWDVLLTGESPREDCSLPDLGDEPTTDLPRVPPASEDDMSTFEEKVQHAEKLLLFGGAWVRARAEPTTSAYNPRKPENVCLRITVGPRLRALRGW